MIVAISEVWPQAHHRNDYFDLAAELRPLLQGIDGFISVERFESLTEPGKILSLFFWRDAEAVAAWRNLEAHRAAQAEGRARDYRLRAASVLRDYGMDNRAQSPGDSCARHEGSHSSSPRP